MSEFTQGADVIRKKIPFIHSRRLGLNQEKVAQITRLQWRKVSLNVLFLLQPRQAFYILKTPTFLPSVTVLIEEKENQNKHLV